MLEPFEATVGIDSVMRPIKAEVVYADEHAAYVARVANTEQALRSALNDCLALIENDIEDGRCSPSRRQVYEDGCKLVGRNPVKTEGATDA